MNKIIFVSKAAYESQLSVILMDIETGSPLYLKFEQISNLSQSTK